MSSSRAARASAQDRREPQRRRHACSIRFPKETSLNALCHGPADSGMTVSRSTTGHPPQHQARPVWHILLWKSAPSAGELLPKPLRLCVPLWSPEPTGHSRKWRVHPPPLPDGPIMHVWPSQIHVAHLDVGGDSASFFMADTGCNVLRCESPHPQNLSTSTCCAVVATGIEWKATPKVAPGQREGKAKTTKEKDSEQMRLQTDDPTQRARGQCQSRADTLRTHQSFRCAIQSAEEVAVSVALLDPGCRLV